MAQQRRRADRIPVSAPVVVKTAGQPQEVLPDVAWVRNLSTSGVYLVFDHELEVGTTLDLVFSVPREIAGDERLIRCRARIVRVEHREDTVGVGAAVEEIKLLARRESEQPDESLGSSTAKASTTSEPKGRDCDRRSGRVDLALGMGSSSASCSTISTPLERSKKISILTTRKYHIRARTDKAVVLGFCRKVRPLPIERGDFTHFSLVYFLMSGF